MLLYGTSSDDKFSHARVKAKHFPEGKRQAAGIYSQSRVVEEEAEDILQDVFYQFVAGFEGIESLDRVTSWLYSVARNKIIDRYRRESVRP